MTLRKEISVSQCLAKGQTADLLHRKLGSYECGAVARYCNLSHGQSTEKFSQEK